MQREENAKEGGDGGVGECRTSLCEYCGWMNVLSNCMWFDSVCQSAVAAAVGAEAATLEPDHDEEVGKVDKNEDVK